MNKNAVIQVLGLGLVNSDSTGVVVNEEIAKRVNAPYYHAHTHKKGHNAN